MSNKLREAVERLIRRVQNECCAPNAAYLDHTDCNQDIDRVRSALAEQPERVADSPHHFHCRQCGDCLAHPQQDHVMRPADGLSADERCFGDFVAVYLATPPATTETMHCRDCSGQGRIAPGGECPGTPPPDIEAAYKKGWTDREADILERVERIAPPDKPPFDAVMREKAEKLIAAVRLSTGSWIEIVERNQKACEAATDLDLAMKEEG